MAYVVLRLPSGMMLDRKDIVRAYKKAFETAVEGGQKVIVMPSDRDEHGNYVYDYDVNYE